MPAKKNIRKKQPKQSMEHVHKRTGKEILYHLGDQVLPFVFLILGVAFFILFKPKTTGFAVLSQGGNDPFHIVSGLLLFLFLMLAIVFLFFAVTRKKLFFKKK